MPKINGRAIEERNIMQPKHVAKARKISKRLAVIDLHPDSFEEVAVPIKGLHQVVLVNEAGTHVRTHQGTWSLGSFITMMERVLELGKKPQIKSVFKGRTKDLLSRYPWGAA